MKQLNLLIASTSTIHGSGYLEYLREDLINHFRQVNEIVFVPYAQPGGISLDKYTGIAAGFFETINKKVKGLHTYSTVGEALREDRGIFVGGGNSFVLLNALYQQNALEPLRQVLQQGAPYLGTSAGSNILGPTIMTTNDMPIVYPPSFAAIGVLPFQINPHFVDADPTSSHMGETRETRIKEYLAFNTRRVLGMREGAWLHLCNGTFTMRGVTGIRLFQKGEEARELGKGEDLTFLFG